MNDPEPSVPVECAYYVQCRFGAGQDALAERWVAWLRDEHIADVLAAGACRADIVQLDAAYPVFEIRYQFPSREVFERYEREHAPRLRAEGLERFPLEWGLEYSRRTGTIVGRFA